MTTFPAGSHIIQIGMIRNACCIKEFNPTYPARLNGIISPEEFHESIKNINKKISMTISWIILVVLMILCTIGGIALVIISKSTSRTFNTILLYVGIGALGFAVVLIIFGHMVIQCRRLSNMRKSILEESKKYSSRSPIACRWRLNTTRYFTGVFRGRVNIVYLHHIIIDVHSTIPRNGAAQFPTNQGPPRSTPVFQPQNIAPPPPYAGQPTAFCAQCGAPIPNPTVNFCGFCGHLFKKY